MSEEQVVSIPYVVYETQQERSDKQHKRLFILCVVLIVALIASNLGWIIYESQFDTIDGETSVIRVNQEADEGGNRSFIGDYNGEAVDSGN